MVCMQVIANINVIVRGCSSFPGLSIIDVDGDNAISTRVSRRKEGNYEINCSKQ